MIPFLNTKGTLGTVKLIYIAMLVAIVIYINILYIIWPDVGTNIFFQDDPALMIITGILLVNGEPLSCLQTSRPSESGSELSRMINFGLSWAALLSASAPL